ncbi:MAG: uncharacterized protein QOD99_1163 [Chthoniobacter sp.]|jgi:predicted RND superfamily exporter protein|nr:uncharacterized protein [Chthoniobacter sp.]
MSLDRTVAHFVTHRRPVVFGAVAVVLLLCAAALIFALRFNSDILDLLPRQFDSVQALKISDREFTNARQLTFALCDESKTLDLEDLAAKFSDALKQEPWAARVTSGTPLDSPDGVSDLQKYLAVPLLLNLEPAAFASAIQALQPERISLRLHELRSKMETMSMAEMKLNFDALGLVQEALKPLAGAFGGGEEAQAFTSADGTIHLAFVETDQADIGPKACQAVMRKVDNFNARFLASCDANARPTILVTGRTAYVDQISRAMHFDIITTLGGSILLVSGVFYFGFRRVWPLVALMHVLMLCCVIAIALGGLIFHELNLITVGLCSILVGLGVDFGMLLYGMYQSQRNAGVEHEEAIAASLRQLGGGIFIGALTTAAGFGSLALSGCAAFAQLGGLIAIGIVFASVLMMTVFFACVSRRRPPEEHDFLFEGGKAYVRAVFKQPKPILIATTLLLVAMSALAIAPVGRLKFEADPKTMEPKCAASDALHTIQQKFPAAQEPLLVLVSAKDPEEFHGAWAKLQARWSQLAADGKIKNARALGAFALSPERSRANIVQLAGVDLPAARATLTQSLDTEGFNASDESFQNSFALIASLEKAKSEQSPATEWRKMLPHSSSWWFVLDQFFAKNSLLGAAYITPITKLRNNVEKESLRQNLTLPGVSMHITGWSYVLADLIPWAKSKLALLSAAMMLFNVVLLAFLYRRAEPLLILMVSLALSIGAMVACLKLFGFALNLFNVLAFPLVLGVGVDYGIYILLALRQPGDREHAFATIIKPVLLAGLTAIVGFASLCLAHNPALRGLGIVCALGVAWCLFATIFFILPAYVAREAK